MRVDFRHGLVRYPTSNNQQVFLQKNGDYIRLSAANGEIVATLAHKSANYLHTESHTVNRAWGPFTTNSNVWLYIDIDRATGERTFGSTNLEPYVSPTAPQNPQQDQHWFDLSNTIMKVYTNGVWVEKIRLIVAKYDGTSISSVSNGIGDFTFAGSTVGLTVSNHSGRILFDGSAQPISNPNTGEFYTTENQFFASAALINNIRLESNVFYAKAKETIPKYHVVTINQNKEMLLANYNQTDSSVLAITTEDAQFGELGAVVLQGVVTNPTWNWETVGQKLWVKSTGQLTDIDPNTTDNLSYPEKQVPVARVLTPTQVIFEQGLGGVGPQGPPGSIEFLPRATTSDLGAVYLSTPVTDEDLPIVASNTDPRLSDARPPEDHTHPADEVTFTPYGNLTAATVKEALQQLDDQKIPLSGGTLEGTIVLNSDPTDPLGAATKRYVDTLVDENVVGLRWLDPLELVNIVGHDLQTPPANPDFGDIYFVPYGASGNWPKDGGGSIPEGHLAQYNAIDWNDLGGVNNFPHEAGFGISIVSDTTASGPALSGHDNEIITINFTNYDVIDLNVSTLQYNAYTAESDGSVRKFIDQTEQWKISAHSDSINDIVVDQSNNFYTASDDSLIKKFDSDGNQLWSFSGHTDNVNAIALDQNESNIYTVSQDGTVRKIDSSGNEITNENWPYSHGAGPIAVNAIALDSNNNVYVGAETDVLKFDSTGTQITTGWPFTAHTSIFQEIIVDSSDNLYTANNDNIARKIDSSGTEIWSFTQHTDVVNGVTIDQSGNLYTASDDNTVRKVDSSGNQLWSYTGYTNAVYSTSVKTNRIYVAGGSGHLIVLDLDGNELWREDLLVTWLADVGTFTTGIYVANEGFVISGDQTSDFTSGDVFYLTDGGSSPNVGGYQVDSVSVNGNGDTVLAVVDDVQQDTSPFGTIYLWSIGSYYTPSDQDAVWVRNALSLYAYNQYVYDGDLNKWIQFGGTQTIEAGEDLEFVGNTLNVLDYDQGGTVNAETLQGNTPADFDAKYAEDGHTHPMGDITDLNIPYDIMFFAAGQMQDINLMVGSVILSRSVYVAKDQNHVAVCNVAPDSDVSYILKHNGTQVGTIDFTAGSTSGTVSMSKHIYGAVSDVIQIFTPDPVEPNIEDVSVTLVGCAELNSCIYSSGPELFIYTASADRTARKLDSNGNQLWSFTGHTDVVQSVAVDSDGNVYTASSDGTARKLDSSGNELWSFTGHTDSDWSYVTDVAVDSDGNVYTASFDQTARKLDSNGNQLWSFTGHTDVVQSVAVDSDGNVYTASADGTARKLDSSGNELWSFTGHTDSDWSYVTDVAVDSDGNVYTASFDQTVRKLDSNGNQLWSFTGHTDVVQSVAVDSDGNVYTASADGTARKLDSSGNELWSFTGHTDVVQSVAVDSDGNVYTASFDQTARKLDSNGNQLWSFTGHTDVVQSVAVG